MCLEHRGRAAPWMRRFAVEFLSRLRRDLVSADHRPQSAQELVWKIQPIQLRIEVQSFCKSMCAVWSYMQSYERLDPKRAIFHVIWEFPNTPSRWGLSFSMMSYT